MPSSKETPMFVVMNKFKINAGHEEAFEQAWKHREGHLNEFVAFIQFSLLKNDTAEDGTVEYVSHTIWGEKANFEAWRDSQQFTRAHGGAGGMDGVMAGPPQVSRYEAVIVERNAPATA